MTVTHKTRQKRFCLGSTELLRVSLAEPVIEDGEGTAAFDSLHAFYREIADRSLSFAENTLFPALEREYGALSDRDRKFSVPKRVYAVEITAAEDMVPSVKADAACAEEIQLSVTLSVTLKRRGGCEFEKVERQLWAKRGGMYELIPQTVDKERKAMKICE